MNDSVKNISDAEFGADVLENERPVLVDFWAPWCGPCKMITPLLEELQQDFAGRLQVVKMNVDEHQATPAKYSVRGIPALLLFVGGELVATHVGVANKGELNALIEPHLTD